MTKTDYEKHVTFYDVDIESIRLLKNRVLVKRITDNAKGKTNSGLYYPSQMHQNQFLYQNADSVFEVVAVPDEITEEGGMWMTDVEVKPGDLAFVERRQALTAEVIISDDGTEYRLINYFAIIVVKRLTHSIAYNNTIPKYINEDDKIYEVIPVNGYILCSDVIKEVGSRFTVLEKYIDKNRAIAEYVGKPNKYYVYKKSKKPDLDKGVDIKPRQKISVDIANKNALINSRKYLEDPLFCKFNGSKMYFYIQRPDVNGVFVD